MLRNLQPFTSIIDLEKLDLSCPAMSRVVCAELEIYIENTMDVYNTYVNAVLAEKVKLSSPTSRELFSSTMAEAMRELQVRLPELAGAIKLLNEETIDESIKKRCSNYQQHVKVLSDNCGEFLRDVIKANIQATSEVCAQLTAPAATTSPAARDNKRTAEVEPESETEAKKPTNSAGNSRMFKAAPVTPANTPEESSRPRRSPKERR